MFLIQWNLVLLFVTYFSCVLNDEIEEELSENSSLEVVHNVDEKLLLFSTLDGNLTAIEQKTGKILWRVQERPIVQVPLDTSNAIVPIFLPDPRDGSLYLIGNITEPLKKLPFTIPQLVSSSPCRSSDGILYTGKKKDTWFKLDPKTGRKQQILGWDDYSPTCPIDSEQSIYIGVTKFNLRMVDGKKSENKWNVTFYDYASTLMSKEDLNNYDLVHFTSTSTGRLLTLDRRRGNILWEEDLGSPIINTYLLDSEGLISVPFTSLANHTINYLLSELQTHNGLLQNPNHMKLYPTLYIGEHLFGLYAIPSLVDQNVVTITASDSGPLLLGGPHAPLNNKIYPEFPLPGHNYRLPRDFYEKDHLNFQSVPTFGNHIIIFKGHYNVPRFSDQKLLGATKDMVLFEFDKDNPKVTSVPEFCKQTGVTNTDESTQKNPNPNYEKVGYGTTAWREITSWFKIHYNGLKVWINQQENKGLKISLIIMTGCVIAMFWYLQIQVREVQNLSQNGSRSSQHSSYGQNNHVTALSEELPNGLVKVGKITFHPDQLLGKGCEGTFVYRGEFDSRRVAVKRLLPECFTFADREVALLRESDAHPNVIRYFCMEQDRMFRYIALELCQANLSDYVQGKCDISPISRLEILRQATCGLGHLHSLGIVHRDIKPHNVLISVPNSKNEVRAMISDFGLCKKLQVGRVSFSRRSGITGTDGWIAPEMLNGSERTTYAVDMFSLGCLYYYVLSDGAHPFGDSLRRQANILVGKFDLSELKGPDWVKNIQEPLLSALICSQPEVRPSCNATLEHPMFWSYDTILSFFQEVSDRVEKAEPGEYVLRELENDGEQIVKLDWRCHIHEEVASDLKKYRTYYGNSVRDLLRALRNKKHHFRELSSAAQKILGEDSEEFTKYWTSRFPLLLAHAWMTMQCVADEENFKKFYHGTHRYSMKQFKKQVAKYLNQNPVELANLVKAEDVAIARQKPKGDFPNSAATQSEKKENSELIRSAGLYRNHNSPEKAKFTGNYYPNKNIQVKRIKRKKVDEPLLWVLENKK